MQLPWLQMVQYEIIHANNLSWWKRSKEKNATLSIKQLKTYSTNWLKPYITEAKENHLI